MLSLLLILFSWAGISQDIDVNKADTTIGTTQYQIEWLEANQIQNDDDDDLFEIDVSGYELDNLYLSIKSDREFYIFDSGALLFKSHNNSVQILLDSLRPLLYSDTLKLLLNNNSDHVSYGFYHLKEKSNTDYPFVSKPGIKEEKFSYEDEFIVLLIIFFILLAIFKGAYPKRFQDVYSISRNFSFRPYEGENIRLRLFEQDGFFLALIYTFASSIIVYLYFSPAESSIFNIREETSTGFFRTWLFISGLLMAKVLIIFTISFLYKSELFKSGKVNAFSIKEILNISTYFITLVIIATAALYLINGYLPAYWWGFVKNTILILYLFRMILVYFKILKLGGFTNLYLFSYFCTTEIFPFVIGLKYFY